MTLKACILAEQAVPRYTSYPTAPHFPAEIGSEIYACWLRALSPDATLSLYLHAPFCAKLCLYCGCHTKIVQRRDPVENYADALAGEIARVAALTGRQRLRQSIGAAARRRCWKQPAPADDLPVTIDGHRIAVTEAGRPFVRLVASAFDAYLALGTARHSRAV